MKNNPKIMYGKKDLVPETIEPKDVSIRISAIFEGDLLNALRTRAKGVGIPYQTLMKEMLRISLGLRGDYAIREKILKSAQNVDLLETLEELRAHVNDEIDTAIIEVAKKKKRA